MPDNRTCPLTADIYRKPDVIDCFYICDRDGLRVTAFPDGMRIQGGATSTSASRGRS